MAQLIVHSGSMRCSTVVGNDHQWSFRESKAAWQQKYGDTQDYPGSFFIIKVPDASIQDAYPHKGGEFYWGNLTLPETNDLEAYGELTVSVERMKELFEYIVSEGATVGN